MHCMECICVCVHDQVKCSWLSNPFKIIWIEVNYMRFRAGRSWRKSFSGTAGAHLAHAFTNPCIINPPSVFHTSPRHTIIHSSKPIDLHTFSVTHRMRQMHSPCLWVWHSPRQINARIHSVADTNSGLNFWPNLQWISSATFSSPATKHTRLHMMRCACVCACVQILALKSFSYAENAIKHVDKTHAHRHR